MNIEKTIELIRKFPIQIIKNSKQHKKAVKLLKELLFDEESKLYVKLLTVVINYYEKQKYGNKLSEDDFLWKQSVDAQTKGYVSKKRSEKLLKEWLEDLDIKVKWSKEDQVYIARCKKYPGIVTHGSTPEKAKKEFKKCVKFIEQG